MLVHLLFPVPVILSKTGAVACRLASGDNEGRVVVWDVSSGTVIASLEDPLSAAQAPGPVARRAEPGKGGAVRGLAWIMSNPCVLGIVLASGMFLVWDMQAGSVLWRKDFGLEHALTTIKVMQASLETAGCSWMQLQLR